MGLAAYGSDRYVDQFRRMVRLGPVGAYELDLSWFDHHNTGKHRVSQKFLDTFGAPRPRTRAPVEQHYADVAYALQHTLEEVGLHIVRWLRRETGLPRLCAAGGVALNSVMNGRLLLEAPFDDFFAPPAASDAGTALGAALYVNTCILGVPYRGGETIFLGPSFTEAQMEAALQASGLPYSRPAGGPWAIARYAAGRIAAGQIVGWFQGRMECGPRALGNRSILADPRNPDTKSRLNEKVKHREPFRPFAPSLLRERAGEYFASDYPSPVMLLVYDVLEHRRAEVPAITHVDGTARVQTVTEEDNPTYWRLIKAFEARTGVPMVVNTSLNDNDEPIVCSPSDAIRCFLKTDLDGLALGPFWVERAGVAAGAAAVAGQVPAAARAA
jgi:carbamoyltransferase